MAKHISSIEASAMLDGGASFMDLDENQGQHRPFTEQLIEKVLRAPFLPENTTDLQTLKNPEALREARDALRAHATEVLRLANVCERAAAAATAEAPLVRAQHSSGVVTKQPRVDAPAQSPLMSEPDGPEALSTIIISPTLLEPMPPSPPVRVKEAPRERARSAEVPRSAENAFEEDSVPESTARMRSLAPGKRRRGTRRMESLAWPAIVGLTLAGIVIMGAMFRLSHASVASATPPVVRTTSRSTPPVRPVRQVREPTQVELNTARAPVAAPVVPASPEGTDEPEPTVVPLTPAATPRFTEVKVVAGWGVPAREIVKALRRSRPGFSRCLQEDVSPEGASPGSLSFQLKVGQDGRVRALHPKSPERGPVERCVSEAVRRAVLPRSASGLKVDLTIQLS